MAKCIRIDEFGAYITHQIIYQGYQVYCKATSHGGEEGVNILGLKSEAWFSILGKTP